MIEFRVLKKSPRSRARLGALKTPHGLVETPALVPVATLANVKTLSSEEVLQTKTQLLIANTFHLHLKPGAGVVKKAGGLHRFMNWPKPLMTDSGGFQVFSLGFGRDLGVGKVLKYFPGKNAATIRLGNQPQHVKITDDGAFFRSPVDGKKLFLGPKESMRIQEALGADIIFAFDECTAPLATLAYAKKALNRTHLWAQQCLDAKKGGQALFGIVQGSRFKALRVASARLISTLGFDGFGIGGDLGSSKQTMKNILGWVVPELDERKPRHLLGIGYLEDIEMVVKQGIDLFDCTVPTHYGRRGIAFTSHGQLNLGRSSFLKDGNPLDRSCGCGVCHAYGRNYLAHLIRAKEITGMKLLTRHNLFFFNAFVERLRLKIKQGKL